MELITRTDRSPATAKVNLPSAPVLVPLLVPFSVIVTCPIGAPELSVILPDTFIFTAVCENPAMENERRKKSGSKIFFSRNTWILRDPIPCRKYPWVSFIQQLIVGLLMV